MMTEGLAYLSFDTVTVYSVLETFLGHADEYLDWYASVKTRDSPEDNSQGEGCHRLATAEKRFNQPRADDALLLPESFGFQ